MLKIISAALAVALVSLDQASAQAVNQRVQGEMFQRIQAATDAYARSLGLDDTYVTYCQTRLNLETAHQPQDGLIPYGVNYNTITTQQQLEQIIEVREAFETVYMRLCLADAKSSLLRASGH